MKKRLGAALIVAMVSLLSACGTKSAPAPSAETGQKGTGAGAAETAGTETAGAEADGTKGADGEIHAPLQETPDLLLRLSEDQSIDYPTTMGCLRFADLVYDGSRWRYTIPGL